MTVTNYNIANEAKYDIGEKLENYGQTKREWLVNYTTGEIISLEEGKYSKLKYGENLAVTDGIILNADPVNMENGESWGEGVTLYGVTEGDGYGWNGTELKFDGVDDYIEIYPSSEVNVEKGLTFEFYAKSNDNTISMLSKTIIRDENSFSSRFRTQYNHNGNAFWCAMSWLDSESDWKIGGTMLHWIEKREIGEFYNEEGGYLTMTANLETNQVSLYWNGEYLDSTICSHEWMISGGLTESSIPFTIGLLINGEVYTENYTKMDLYACRLYNKVLTDEEIKQNCEKTVAYHNLLVKESNQ